MALATDKTSRALISNPSSLQDCFMTLGNALNLSELQFSCLSSVGNSEEPTHRTAVKKA